MGQTKSSSAELNRRGVSRRQMLKQTAVAGGVLAAPYIVPASVLGRNGAVPPSEKILLGCIGIGDRGRYVLNCMMKEDDVRCVAICDLQISQQEAAKKLVDEKYGNNDCKTYVDIREFLATRNDIDTVLIATGDRWHALASIMAMRAGKDVFSEKPSCMTIAEGQAVVDTARQTGRVYQSGIQRLSDAKFLYCIEMARLGRLGKVHTARAHIAPWETAILKMEWLPPEPLPSNDATAWDLWLGPCPWRPFNSAYLRGAWRCHYDFHTSCIGNWGAHTFAQAQAGLNALDTSPVEYEYVDNDTGDGMVTRFADGTKMILHRENWGGPCGMSFEGPEGWVSCADGYEKPDVSNPAMLADFDKIVADYVERTGHPVGHSMIHVRDFFNSVRSRKPTVANPEVMFHSMSTVHAANICMWLRRNLKYDPAKSEFEDADANGFRSRPMRAPWVI
ncbi:MAG: Gfo/Idh/MocA family oxidoreductase [Phycisphaerales bacterium]|nr:Gfo/Idh/MocA family oxidoreductase [Phycisphaerales bacterium]